SVETWSSTISTEQRYIWCVVVQAVHPAVAIVLEIGVQQARIKIRAVSQPVVGAPSDPPPRSVVPVIANINRVFPEHWRTARECGEIRNGLDVVNTTAIPVIRAPDQQPEFLARAEALADCACRLDKAAATQDRHVATHTAECHRGPLTCRFCDQI